MPPEVTFADIEAAARRLEGLVVRTPLVKLGIEDAPAEIYLKLENLQPIGSFKLRGAGNAMALADPAALSAGVVTASAGNMAQGVAWHARRLGVPCTVIVPDTAPPTKLAAIARLGARTVKVPRERWWEIVVSHDPGMPGLFVHPVSDARVIAGNVFSTSSADGSLAKSSPAAARNSGLSLPDGGPESKDRNANPARPRPGRRSPDAYSWAARPNFSRSGRMRSGHAFSSALKNSIVRSHASFAAASS